MRNPIARLLAVLGPMLVAIIAAGFVLVVPAYADDVEATENCTYEYLPPYTQRVPEAPWVIQTVQRVLRWCDGEAQPRPSYVLLAQEVDQSWQATYPPPPASVAQSYTPPAQTAPASAPASQPAAAPQPAPAQSGGPCSWGSAGQAPQNVDAAADALKVNRKDLLTKINCPVPAGNQLVIGWVLGTNESERAEPPVQVKADRVQNGLCVDFDDRISDLNGTAAGVKDFDPSWRRVLLGSDGSFVGRKATFYWSAPCEGITSSGSTTQASQPASSAPQASASGWGINQVLIWCPACKDRLELVTNETPNAVLLKQGACINNLAVPANVEYNNSDGKTGKGGTITACHTTFRLKS